MSKRGPNKAPAVNSLGKWMADKDLTDKYVGELVGLSQQTICNLRLMPHKRPSLHAANRLEWVSKGAVKVKDWGYGEWEKPKKRP